MHGDSLSFLAMQMIVRSPVLLGLTHETLTTRMKALEAACPKADVQRMIEHYPSLLEVNPAIATLQLTVLMSLCYLLAEPSYGKAMQQYINVPLLVTLLPSGIDRTHFRHCSALT